MKHLIAGYGLNEKDLEVLCKGYERFFSRHGIAFEYVGKEDVKEYALQEDFETGTSNGERLSFERNVKKAGGWHVRAFDMFHLIGHYCQWNYVGSEPKLDFVGDYGWEVGVTDFTRPENATELALRYEIEAAGIAFHFLDKVLADLPFGAEKKQALRRFMNDYQQADKAVLRAFYDDNNPLSHAETWKKDAETIPAIAINLATEIRATNRNRENLALIPVLHFEQPATT
jgi:hypothetical protein